MKIHALVFIALSTLLFGNDATYEQKEAYYNKQIAKLDMLKAKEKAVSAELSEAKKTASDMRAFYKDQYNLLSSRDERVQKTSKYYGLTFLKTALRADQAKVTKIEQIATFRSDELYHIRGGIKDLESLIDKMKIVLAEEKPADPVVAGDE